MKASTSAVSSDFITFLTRSNAYQSLHCLASNGNAAHLLKAGSKRRRTQAEIKGQLEIDQLSEVVAAEREEEISKLKSQLEKAEAYCNENQKAVEIVKGLLEKGTIKEEEDGSITVANGPNFIGNQEDHMN